MDYKNFQNAITAAGNTQAPATPYPELAALMRSSFQTPLSKVGVAGIGNVSGLKSKQDEQAASVARQQQIDDIKTKMSATQDMLDPKKYTQQRSQDGGYDFFDPSGKKIDIGQYSQVTGKSPKDILKNSENPIDQQFTQDYKSLQELSNAFANGDKDYINKLPQQMQDYLKGKTMSDVMTDFKKQYPGIYQTGQGLGSGQQPSQNALRGPAQGPADSTTTDYPIFNQISSGGQPQNQPQAQQSQGTGNFLQDILNRLGSAGGGIAKQFGGYRGF